jgi:excisionase family DNA binding protein
MQNAKNVEKTEKLVLNKPEVAALLGVGLVTLDNCLIKPGLLRTVKIGARVLIPRDALLEFLAGKK